MKEGILGVDIGGVIIDRVNDNTDTSFFGDRFLETTAVPGVFDALQRLVMNKFLGDVYLVSKCGQRVQQKTLNWLDHHEFYSITGIDRGNVKFCRERHEKAGICRELGITHFVDDRLEVLSHLIGIVPTLYLFQPNPSEVARFSRYLPEVIEVDTWQEILRKELPVPA